MFFSQLCFRISTFHLYNFTFTHVMTYPNVVFANLPFDASMQPDLGDAIIWGGTGWEKLREITACIIYADLLADYFTVVFQKFLDMPSPTGRRFKMSQCASRLQWPPALWRM